MNGIIVKLCVFITAIITSSLVYMLLDNVPPYDFKSGRIEPNPATSGRNVNVIWDIEVRRYCPGTVYRTIVGPITKSNASVVYFYDPIHAIISKSNVNDFRNKELIVTFSIPFVQSIGAYNYAAKIDYECNWLQKFFPLRVNLPVVPFEILADK